MSIYWLRNGKKSDDAWQPQAERKTSSPAAAYSQIPTAPVKRAPKTDARHLMKSPVMSLTPEATLNEAKTFLKGYRFRHVPVVDADGRLVGLISDRDLWKESARSRDSLADWIEESGNEGRHLRDFMTKNLLTATPEARIRDIARAMFIERIGCMPVIDKDDKVVGMITRSDILRHLVESMPLEAWI